MVSRGHANLLGPELKQLRSPVEFSGERQNRDSAICVLLPDSYLFPFYSYLIFSKDMWKANLGISLTKQKNQVGEKNHLGHEALSRADLPEANICFLEVIQHHFMILHYWSTDYKGTATPKKTENENFPRCFPFFSLQMFMCCLQAEGKTQQIFPTPSSAFKIPPQMPKALPLQKDTGGESLHNKLRV